MRTEESIKNEKISHLEYCLEKLLQKDDGYNEMDIKHLYTLIYRVVCEMRELDADEALKRFNNSIDDNVRNLLCKYNIELVV